MTGVPICVSTPEKSEASTAKCRYFFRYFQVNPILSFSVGNYIVYSSKIPLSPCTEERV